MSLKVEKLLLLSYCREECPMAITQLVKKKARNTTETQTDKFAQDYNDFDSRFLGS